MYRKCGNGGNAAKIIQNMIIFMIVNLLLSNGNCIRGLIHVRGLKKGRDDMRKLLLVASSGGHMEELTRLKSITERYDCCWVTEKNNFQKYGKVEEIQYYVPQVNRREILFPLKFFLLFFVAFYVLIKEKPEVVISTGALISYPFCRLAKMMGKKVIFIESFARVNELSLTGKLLYKHVNTFIVQWSEIAQKYDKAIVGGGIF
jgi:UDP-N-acetylglucosamine:LPS N-acetylglucosamine transferase